DWSSDVCSSDLVRGEEHGTAEDRVEVERAAGGEDELLVGGEDPGAKGKDLADRLLKPGLEDPDLSAAGDVADERQVADVPRHAVAGEPHRIDPRGAARPAGGFLEIHVDHAVRQLVESGVPLHAAMDVRDHLGRIGERDRDAL